MSDLVYLLNNIKNEYGVEISITNYKGAVFNKDAILIQAKKDDYTIARTVFEGEFVYLEEIINDLVTEAYNTITQNKEAENE